MSSEPSTATALAPASPFEARPEPTQPVVALSPDDSSLDSPASATSDSTLVNNSSAVPGKAELTGGHRRISYPLTSFESTPHNVSAIGFALGIVFTLGLVLASGALSHKSFLWGSQSVSSLEAPGLVAALTNPVVGIYLTFWATFHMLEFQVTSIWNPGKLSVDCQYSSTRLSSSDRGLVADWWFVDCLAYLINNGAAYPIAHAVGLIEHILETAFLPSHYRLFKAQGGLVLIGAGIVLAGQVLRSLAMISAASNFSHM